MLLSSFPNFPCSLGDVSHQQTGFVVVPVAAPWWKKYWFSGSHDRVRGCLWRPLSDKERHKGCTIIYIKSAGAVKTFSFTGTHAAQLPPGRISEQPLSKSWPRTLSFKGCVWPSWHWHSLQSCHVVDKSCWVADCRGRSHYDRKAFPCPYRYSTAMARRAREI